MVASSARHCLKNGLLTGVDRNIGLDVPARINIGSKGQSASKTSKKILGLYPASELTCRTLHWEMVAGMDSIADTPLGAQPRRVSVDCQASGPEYSCLILNYVYVSEVNMDLHSFNATSVLVQSHHSSDVLRKVRLGQPLDAALHCVSCVDKTSALSVSTKLCANLIPWYYCRNHC